MSCTAAGEKEVGFFKAVNQMGVDQLTLMKTTWHALEDYRITEYKYD